MASRELHVPLSMVYISETSTGTVPNTPPTAASYGTDANGMAVKVAPFSCRGSSETSGRIRNHVLAVCPERLSDPVPAAGAVPAEEPQRIMGELGRKPLQHFRGMFPFLEAFRRKAGFTLTAFDDQRRPAERPSLISGQICVPQ